MLSYNLPFFVLLFYPKSSRLYHRNRHFSTPYAKKMYKTNLKYFFWIFLIFLNFSIDIIQFLSYYKWAVDERSKQSKASRLKKCRNGGIGRRAGFRCLWSQDRVGSSPISCILFLLSFFQECLCILAARCVSCNAWHTSSAHLCNPAGGYIRWRIDSPTDIDL